MTSGEFAQHDTRAPGPRPVQHGSGSADGQRLLTPEILALAAVVVLGSFMTILETAMSSVATAIRDEGGTAIEVTGDVTRFSTPGRARCPIRNRAATTTQAAGSSPPPT